MFKNNLFFENCNATIFKITNYAFFDTLDSLILKS